MPVIVVVNRKGGSGKSTLATHLAAYAANNSIPVMLGDIDRQQSSRTWLNLRQQTTKASMPPIQTWAHENGRSFTPPASVKLMVLDTPGGLHGLELAKVVMVADAIIMPVCNSIFDRESAADCIEELKRLPKIASGRCRLGIVGMRIDSRTGGAAEIAAWADKQKVPYVAHIRQSRLYPNCIEQGLTIFDAPPHVVQFDVQQWQPILDWLEPCLAPARMPNASTHPNRGALATQIRPGVPNGYAPNAAAQQAPQRRVNEVLPEASTKRGFFGSLTVPAFLKQTTT